MDLISEASSGSRIFTARHVNVEKALPVFDEAVNTTFLCHNYNKEPEFAAYHAALQPYSWAIWSTGLVVLMATCVISALSIRKASQIWKDCFLNVAIVLLVYPLVSASAFITVLVPRARILSEALAQQAVMVAMYHLFCLLIAECGGPSQLVRRAGGACLETRVLPCCCWPCCVIPRPQIQKKHLQHLRYLVLQMPVIQAIIYIFILTIWLEDSALYFKNFVWIQPVVAASILPGVWGAIMCVRAAEAAGSRPRARFLALQFVLLIVKLQCGSAKLIAEVFTLPCILPIHPSVLVNMIQNCLMMLEMLLLGLWAWRLYGVPPGKIVDKVQPVVVAVLDDSILDVKSKDGIDNRSFKSETN